MIDIYDESTHYEMLESWWKGHEWEPVNPQLLKPLGLVITIENQPVAAGFIYPIAGCGLALLEWVVSNPEAKPFCVVKGMKQLIDYTKDWCKDNDYQILLSACKNRGLLKLYQKNGFTKLDEGITHLGMKIGEEE